MPSTLSTMLCRRSMASFLLFSIPMIACLTSMAFINICIPITISSARSSIIRWSAVRYGSHSTPLIISTSALLPGGGVSFTWVGKVAPPIPTIPAAAIALTISSLVRLLLCSIFSERLISGIHSSPSVLMVIAGLEIPAASVTLSIETTVPETEL